MAMLLREFHSLKLDLVSKFSVRGYVEEPRFVTLTLYHASPSGLLHRREPKKVAVLLTLDQADQLAAQLAKRGHKAQPKPSPEGRRRGVREQHR
jgi:hypothetical protein